MGAPAEDHAEGQDEEEGGGFGGSENSVEVAAGEETDGGKNQDHGEKGIGALHHNGAALANEARGEQQRVGERYGPGQKGGSGPEPGNPESWDEEHAEAGGHAERRNDDFFERDGTTGFAEAPSGDNGESCEREKDG